MAFLDETMQKLGMRGGAACRVCIYPEAGAVAGGWRGAFFYFPPWGKLRTRGGTVVFAGGALTGGGFFGEEIIFCGEGSCVRWE